MSKIDYKSKDVYTFEKDINVDLLRDLIMLIDGYLVNYFSDFEPFEHKIKSGVLGSELAKEWKYIKRSLMRIATTVKRIPGLKSLVKLCTIFKVLTLLFTISGTSLIISAQFTSQIYMYYLSMLFLTFSAISIVWNNILERKLSRRIGSYFEEHSAKYGTSRNYLRSIVQKLIFSMADYFKTKKIEPMKYPFSLYNEDYKGIKIIKKKGLFRSRSKVTVAID